MITLYNMDVRKALSQIKSESISCVMTSPPYWALRDYGSEVETIWDEKEGCEHNWNEEITKRPNASGGKGHLQDGNEGSFIVDYSKRETKSNFCSRCGTWKGQLGLEPTFDLYIKHLCDVFDEVKRVLRKDGTCWVNLGDTYSATRWTNNEDSGQPMNNFKDGHRGINPEKITNLQDKNLCLIPFRFAIEMQNRGWILRNDIIWYKRNCMPSSVKDRFTVDFEHIFFFVKSKRYWFERQYDEIAESSFNDNKKDKGLVPHKKGKDIFNDKRKDRGLVPHKTGKTIQEIPKQDLLGKPTYTGFNKRWMESQSQYAINGTCINSFGRNKRCVWDITTQPYREAHFATFPEGLVETPIKAGCPEFICSKCGKAREKIFEKEKPPREVFTNVRVKKDDFAQMRGGSFVDGERLGHGGKLQEWLNEHPLKQIGLTSCSCSAPFVPGIVLDPFAGSGTTLKVARDLHRDSIGIEIKKQYCDLIFKRLYNGNVPLINDFQLIQ